MNINVTAGDCSLLDSNFVALLNETGQAEFSDALLRAKNGSTCTIAAWIGSSLSQATLFNHTQVLMYGCPRKYQLQVGDTYDTCIPVGKHLHIDYMPFYDYSPSIKDAKTIGNGIRYLNRYLSSNIFSRLDEWNAKLFNFIKLNKHNGQQLLVNGSILTEFDSFYNGVQDVAEWLEKEKPETTFPLVEKRMKRAGFEAGWGNTVGRIFGTMQLLIDLLNEPTDILLEQFLSRVPMPLISKIAIISPQS